MLLRNYNKLMIHNFGSASPVVKDALQSQGEDIGSNLLDPFESLINDGGILARDKEELSRRFEMVDNLFSGLINQIRKNGRGALSKQGDILLRMGAVYWALLFFLDDRIEVLYAEDHPNYREEYQRAKSVLAEILTANSDEVPPDILSSTYPLVIYGDNGLYPYRIYRIGRHIAIAASIISRLNIDQLAHGIGHEMAHLGENSDKKKLELLSSCGSLEDAPEAWKELHHEIEFTADRKGLSLILKAGFDGRRAISIFDVLLADLFPEQLHDTGRSISSSRFPSYAQRTQKMKQYLEKIEKGTASSPLINQSKRSKFLTGMFKAIVGIGLITSLILSEIILFEKNFWEVFAISLIATLAGFMFKWHSERTRKEQWKIYVPKQKSSKDIVFGNNSQSLEVRENTIFPSGGKKLSLKDLDILQVNQKGLEADYIMELAGRERQETKVFLFRHLITEVKARPESIFVVNELDAAGKEIFIGGLFYYILKNISKAFTPLNYNDRLLSQEMKFYSFYVNQHYRGQYYLRHLLLSLAVEYMRREQNVEYYYYEGRTPESEPVLKKIFPGHVYSYTLSKAKSQEVFQEIHSRVKATILADWLVDSASSSPVANKKNKFPDSIGGKASKFSREDMRKISPLTLILDWNLIYKRKFDDKIAVDDRQLLEVSSKSIVHRQGDPLYFFTHAPPDPLSFTTHPSLFPLFSPSLEALTLDFNFPISVKNVSSPVFVRLGKILMITVSIIISPLILETIFGENSVWVFLSVPVGISAFFLHKLRKTKAEREKRTIRVHHSTSHDRFSWGGDTSLPVKDPSSVKLLYLKWIGGQRNIEKVIQEAIKITRVKIINRSISSHYDNPLFMVGYPGYIIKVVSSERKNGWDQQAIRFLTDGYIELSDEVVNMYGCALRSKLPLDKSFGVSNLLDESAIPEVAKYLATYLVDFAYDIEILDKTTREGSRLHAEQEVNAYVEDAISAISIKTVSSAVRKTRKVEDKRTSNPSRPPVRRLSTGNSMLYPSPFTKSLLLDPFDKAHYFWDKNQGCWVSNINTSFVLDTHEGRFFLQGYNSVIRLISGRSLYLLHEHRDELFSASESMAREEIKFKASYLVRIDDHSDDIADRYPIEAFDPCSDDPIDYYRSCRDVDSGNICIFEQPIFKARIDIVQEDESALSGPYPILEAWPENTKYSVSNTFFYVKQTPAEGIRWFTPKGGNGYYDLHSRLGYVDQGDSHSTSSVNNLSSLQYRVAGKPIRQPRKGQRIKHIYEVIPMLPHLKEQLFFSYDLDGIGEKALFECNLEKIKEFVVTKLNIPFIISEVLPLAAYAGATSLVASNEYIEGNAGIKAVVLLAEKICASS
ncbi:MAG: hypothetical protein ABIE75_03400, partial [Candidatus Omnitrophota bacterium]